MEQARSSDGLPTGIESLSGATTLHDELLVVDHVGAARCGGVGTGSAELLSASGYPIMLPYFKALDNRNLIGYTSSVIRNFKHKGLERFFVDGIKRGIQHKHAKKLSDILDLLDAAKTVQDMNFPGAVLHPLKGKLKGFWAVRVSGNWRVVFRFENGEAYDVDYLDYH